ncbi:hypothetical protein CHS0354_015002 [Potamilus streckersoni]|uniref:Tetraspanin n=1 Tax=Potamilus streckersoni TaxID=2493646 RepID=A0AAE0SMK6_9BIVA|nr:hypothetical protein CHS0354_015002 [Potamilus streckersoni]
MTDFFIGQLTLDETDEMNQRIIYALDRIGGIITVIINFVFMLIGLAGFCGGLVVKFGSSIYEAQITPIETSIENSVSSSGLGIVHINLDIAAILEPFSFTLIFSGLLIFVLCIFGCCGVCYKVEAMLISFQDSLKSSLKSGIKADYRGLNGTNLVSMGWNVVMQNMNCCGVDSYEDFTGAENWITSYTFGMTTYNLVTPLGCCKELPSSIDLFCASSPNDDNNNWKTNGYVIGKLGKGACERIVSVFLQ